MLSISIFISEYPRIQAFENPSFKAKPPLLLTFFPVPLEPRSPRFGAVTASSVELRWQPPANAPNLGRDLLGYRVYLTERCNGGGKQGMKRCRSITPATVNSGATTETVVKGLSEYCANRKAYKGRTNLCLLLREFIKPPPPPPQTISLLSCFPPSSPLSFLSPRFL